MPARQRKESPAPTVSATLRASLRGLRVLELSRYVPGPFCCFLLSELGAEVWKVEEPGGGDPLRALDPEAFRRLNRGKKSLAIDLKSKPGRSVFLRLVGMTDVLVEGFRPGAMERLGLGAESICRRFPRLVYLSISGYGQEGPYRERAGHDLNYLAVAGALGSEVPRIQVADFAAGGLYGALAVVAALFRRTGSGRGGYIDLAMVDGVVSFLALALSRAGELLSGRYPNYGIYRTRDGRNLSVAALEPKFWSNFCRALRREDLSRRAGDPAARTEVEKILAAGDLEDWMRIFSRSDVCVEPVSRPETARDHPQVAHRGITDPELGTPLARSHRSRAPALGEHTRPVLTEIGFGEEELSRLETQGVL